MRMSRIMCMDLMWTFQQLLSSLRKVSPWAASILAAMVARWLVVLAMSPEYSRSPHLLMTMLYAFLQHMSLLLSATSRPAVLGRPAEGLSLS